MNIVMNHKVHKTFIQTQLREIAQTYSATRLQENQEEKADKNQIGNLLESIMKMMTAGNYYNPKHF